MGGWARLCCFQLELVVRTQPAASLADSDSGWIPAAAARRASCFRSQHRSSSLGSLTLSLSLVLITSHALALTSAMLRTAVTLKRQLLSKSESQDSQPDPGSLPEALQGFKLFGTTGMVALAWEAALAAAIFPQACLWTSCQ
jgi:hypothetical protein